MKTIIPFLPEKKQVHTDIAMEVYESLLGQTLPQYRLCWVDDIFIPGHPCHDAYAQMLEAYENLCDRLGTGSEDADAEAMVTALLTYSRIIGMEMFRYGRIYENMTK